MEWKTTRKALSTLAIAFGFACAANTGVVSAADRSSASEIAASGDRANAGTDPVNRYELAARILDRWQPIAVKLGQNAQTWREIFTTQLGMMGEPLLVDLASVRAVGGAKAAYARFAQAFRNASMQLYMQSRLSKVETKLGSPSSDLVYIPIVPCRIVDTRNLGGPIGAGFARNFFYYAETPAFDFAANQGGEPGAAAFACPETVYTDGAPALGAAAITITVIDPTDAGNAVVWGGAGPTPSISVLNWKAGEILANTTIVPGGGRSGSGPGGTVEDFAIYYNGPSGSANFTADVVGYFVENVATALSCTYVTSPFTPIAAQASGSAQTIACPVGYTLTGGSCISGNVNLNISTSRDNAPANFAVPVWFCSAFNYGTVTATLQAAGTCCRLPGR